MMDPIHIFCTLYTPYMHTHMLFSRFCTLLCALVTVDTAYTIYFVLIHHCTNSLSSLHIFVHHCTFWSSLHTKTSPDDDDDGDGDDDDDDNDDDISWSCSTVIYRFQSATQETNKQD